MTLIIKDVLTLKELRQEVHLPKCFNSPLRVLASATSQMFDIFFLCCVTNTLFLRIILWCQSVFLISSLAWIRHSPSLHMNFSLTYRQRRCHTPPSVTKLFNSGSWCSFPSQRQQLLWQSLSKCGLGTSRSLWGGQELAGRQARWNFSQFLQI